MDGLPPRLVDTGTERHSTYWFEGNRRRIALIYPDDLPSTAEGRDLLRAFLTAQIEAIAP